MANTNTLKLTGLLILILGLTLLPTNILSSKAQPGSAQESLAKRTELLERKLAQDRRQADLDRNKKNFRKTKELLIKKGVPFDPEILLTANWRKTLAPHFDQMAEMQEVKIGPRRIKGVQMAHTLYLPENVELVGNTVILARRLVFEGRHAVIKGTFSISVYPIDQTGLLGETLDQALQRSGPRFINARFGRLAARNVPASLAVIKGGSLTIDTSGRGYKQWLQENGFARNRSWLFKPAILLEERNTSGAAGKPGTDALPGADGPPVLSTGVVGTAGTCGSTSSVNGKSGGNGPSGNNGQRPTKDGGKGDDGEPAEPIEVNITDNSIPTYYLRAIGGDGGPGGRGGTGGAGSKGGRGGQGGIGANCPCDQGGSGAGGPGGSGGVGGSGGNGSNGGQGGNGGNGGDIKVRMNASYNVEIDQYNGGGARGLGGAAGLYGLRGLGGDGGPGGLSGGVSFCLNQGWMGDTGAKGLNGAEGEFGTDGQPGVIGAQGNYDFRISPPTYEPESPIIIDLDGNGYSLTDATHGVNFDLNADGPAERLGWTSLGSDDAFLSLDLNQNGMIDSGAELFGNYTPQPQSSSPNGFIALAEFDKAENGGNANGMIDAGDAVFARLTLWQDTNHNGFSDSGELRSLAHSGITTMSLDYQQSNRRDQFGNLFYYRSRIGVGTRRSVERWAYDIFLVVGS